LPLFIKGPLKEGLGLLLFAFEVWFGGLWGLGFFGFWHGLWLDSFALGFLMWEAFGREKNY
jgi:hypothetical protein